jgi:dTDP-4-amino-4,6-dideoxygalactose transaminase
LWEYYFQHLQSWAHSQQVGLPVVPAHNEQAYHLFYMLMPSVEARQALIKHLRSLKILSVFHYQPLHLSDMGRRFGGQPGMCPMAEAVSERIIRLPFYNDLPQCMQEKVVEAVRHFAV